jgi:N-methylhydantoinase A
MMRAVKAVSTYRGRDPRDFDLLAFGGNGPIYAAEMARELGIYRVLVPPAAGLFSAFGLLEADLERHLVQTFGGRIEEIDCAGLNATFARMERAARAAMADGGDRVVCQRRADVRYAGQAYELTVPVQDGEIGPSELAALARAFVDEHERTHGHQATDEPVELVNLRLVARIDRPRTASGLPLSGGRERGLGDEGSRPAYFGPVHGTLNTPLLSRSHLDTAPRQGPLIVEEYDATVVVPPDCHAGLDAAGNIVIEVPAS